MGLLLQNITELLYKLLPLLPEKGVEYLFSLLKSEITQASEVEAEITKLKDMQDRICSLLHDVEVWRHVTEENVLRWLGDLRDVALDAEDLKEKFETRLALSKLPANGRKRKRGWDEPLARFLFRRRMAKEIREVKDRYEEIYEDRRKLRLQRGDAPRGDAPRRVQAPEAPPTGALVGNGLPTLGRSDDKDRIVELLLQDGETAGGNRLSVVPVYGTPGQGKTTLARYVFDDDAVRKYFGSRIWVCVTGGFKVERIANEILESLGCRTCHLSNFTTFQRRVRELLGGGWPFLLVLDNVGDDGPLHWQDLQAFLPVGDGRSRVLITTRSENVAGQMGTVQCGRLNGLSDDDCFSLFAGRACPEGGLDQNPTLQDIGRQIARKCQGSPLAAISLGGLLYRQTDEAEWRSLLKETVEFSQRENDILPILNHAIELLPRHLKKCFAFCAIFPDGHQFDKDSLVKLWMAQGFIESRGGRRLEAMGAKCFDELLWISFFQASDHCKQNPRHQTTYQIPGLMHELSQLVSKREYFKMASNLPLLPGVPESARHLVLSCGNEDTIALERFHEHRRLRTFVLQGESRVGIEKLPSDLFPKLIHLRVLDLSNSAVTELPDSIGELILLRYLSLYNSLIQGLPDSVTGLYNLQTLELGECYKLLELPEGTSNLKNLRHLGLHLDPRRVSSNPMSMPPAIGKLTSLETLSRFAVGTRTGCGLSELKDLKNLRGELWVSKLENVVTKEDAEEANLKDKRGIEDLTLQWSMDPDLQHVQSDVDVIGRLEPPALIKYLRVDGYDGPTVPSWLDGTPPFSELVCLRLSHCKRWEALPSLGRLPLLRELYVEGMHGIKSMDNMFPGSGSALIRFPSLEKLCLWDLPIFVAWCVLEGEMPHLSELHIRGCRGFIALPRPPCSQTTVTIIEDCEALSTLPATANSLQDSTERPGMDE